MPKLRGHHLICLQFFNGEGYDETFIRNLEHVLRQAEEEEITVTSGADDVCAACLHLKQGKCEYSDHSDEEVRKMDKKALELLGFSETGSCEFMSLPLQDSLRKVFPQWRSLYCQECDWKGICEKNELYSDLSRLL